MATATKSLKRVPNLDGMFLDDIKRYRRSIKKRGTHYDWVRSYCALKIDAMTARLKGRIDNALKLERHCDAIYSNHLRGKVDW